jgi:UDP-glucose 4-epimerase
MKKCLVTGGNGFIGRFLVKRLLDERNEVEVLDVEENCLDKRAKFTKASVGDSEKIKKAVNGKEIVFHLASTTFPASSIEKPLYDAETNLLPAIRLFEECVNAGVEKVFFPSSGGAVYGNSENHIVNEETPSNPESPHAIVKLAVEKYLNYYNKIHGLDYLCFRIGNAYGEGQSAVNGLGFVAAVLEKAKKKETLNVFGDGKAVRDFVHVNDIVDAFILGIEAKPEHNVFNIASGEGKSLNEVIEIAEKVIGNKIKKEYLPARKGEVKRIVLDISRAKKELGFNPEISLEEGIKRAWESMQ